MSSTRLILASLLHHWRMNLAVACGVAAGTAVLSGALLVGDSMRASLERLTLERLGRIDQVLLTDRFFRAELAEQLARRPDFPPQYSEAVPLILLPASVHWQAGADKVGRANRVNLLGCDRRFWRLGSGGPKQLPTRRQIVLNGPLADQLGVKVGEQLIAVKVGDRVMLRLPTVAAIPADSALGRKTETVTSHPLTVSQIIPAQGLGRFSLRPSQQLPRNAYVSLEWLQDRLDQPRRANTILVAGKTAGADRPPENEDALEPLLQPTPDDHGIRIEQTPHRYINLTSDRMVLTPAAEKAVLAAAQKSTLVGGDSSRRSDVPGRDVQPALTYLANTIACKDRQIPYSTITAIDFTDQPPLGPFVSTEDALIGPLDDDQIVLNSWAAEDLGAEPGDRIRVTYFEPESTHGQLEENSVDLQLAAVVLLAGAAADRAFTPKVPGVTDELSMAEWNPPFPFDATRIRAKDEAYWDAHGPTPKAFVSLAAGRRLWGSRFGQTTSLRLRPTGGIGLEALRKKLARDPAALGLDFQPVKQQGLAASQGTTPFEALFLAFSFFLIAAAVMLVALLFRLGIERRAGQLGILVATGFSRRKIARLLAAEGLLVAALGSLIGVPAGVGYAAWMLLGLRTWWLAAVVTPFLQLHLTAGSVVIGFTSGVMVGLAAIVWSVWRTRHVTPRQLLAGQASDFSPLVKRRPPFAGKAAWAILVATVAVGLVGGVALGVYAGQLGEQTRAGAFFGVGAMVLSATLTFMWICLRSGATGPAVAAGRGNLLRLALRNAARNPGRSALTIGLVASACFLIVAVSAFRLDPTGQLPNKDSGNGGFLLVSQSDQSVYHEFNTPEGSRELGFSEEDQRLLADTRTILLRVKPGDDASCLNLYRPRQPRVLGIPDELIDRGGFAWAGSAAWSLLEEDLGSDDDGTPLVPVVIDKNTAMYSLHLWKGVGETYDVTDGRRETVRLKVVGLLADSIFQGDLLIGEKAFLRHFPEVSGYRFFLSELKSDPARLTPEKIGDSAKALRATLESALGDYGLASETTAERLAGFLAVQNTYLLTFQSLGGLGLLLGTFGLAAVQLRNVLERRGELALLRATGFRRSTLAAMVMLENGLLLSAGLAGGLLAALVAVLPHLLAGGAMIPWASLAGTLALVLAVGLVAGLAAVRATLAAPLLAALREER